MRFSLRTLMLAMVVIPPLVALAWWYPFASMIVAGFTIYIFLLPSPPDPPEYY